MIPRIEQFREYVTIFLSDHTIWTGCAISGVIQVFSNVAFDTVDFFLECFGMIEKKAHVIHYEKRDIEDGFGLLDALAMISNIIFEWSLLLCSANDCESYLAYCEWFMMNGIYDAIQVHARCFAFSFLKHFLFHYVFSNLCIFPEIDWFSDWSYEHADPKICVKHVEHKCFTSICTLTLWFFL